jgi:hypothetical protein
VHARECFQVAAGIEHGDVHLPPLVLSLGDARLDDLARYLKGQDRPHLECRCR